LISTNTYNAPVFQVLGNPWTGHTLLRHCLNCLTCPTWVSASPQPQSMATFAGGWVGLPGVEKIRNIADRVTDFKLPSRKPE